MARRSFSATSYWKIPDAVKEVLYSRAAREDNPREVLWCIAVNCFIAIVILLVFVFVGKQALDFFYGPDFVPAYRLVLLLFAGTVPMIFYKMIHPLYIANRRPGVIVGILGISVAVNIAGNLYSFLHAPHWARPSHRSFPTQFAAWYFLENFSRTTGRHLIDAESVHWRRHINTLSRCV